MFSGKPEKQFIPVRKTARYFTLGEINEQTTSLFFVCHGYGYLAENCIKDFTVLVNDTTAVIAPEGLHRFYLKGFSGNVGASWMTREDREHDIEDYVNYLDDLYSIILKKGHPNVKITVIGFSQGAATVSRWLTLGKSYCHHLVLWAGLFPPDLDFAISNKALRETRLTLVCGKNDPFLQQVDIDKQKNVLRKNDIEFDMICFDGEHEINEKVLLNFK